MGKEKVVAIIPARGGSKGLPRKNIRELAGKPLIWYSIEPALKSKFVDHVVVSTEDEEIAEISKSLGAEVPFLRDRTLARDRVGCNEVMIWTVNRLFEEGHLSNRKDITVYLQPTDLFKKSEWIDECVKTLIDNPEADTVFLGCEEHKNFWEKTGQNMYQPLGGCKHPGHDNRQVKKTIYREDTGMGAAIRAYVWTEMTKRIGENNIVIPKEYIFFDIHSDLDLYMAEQYLKFKKAVE